MNPIIVIGGGIIGLSSAYYLRESGHDVVVLDQGDFLDNCSHGNMGYVCPSHFIPLASPEKLRQGVKWMLNPQSPFYIRPTLNRTVIDWGIKFLRSATVDHVKRAHIPLRDLALLSQHEYQLLHSLSSFNFPLYNDGLLEIFNTHAAKERAEHIVSIGNELNLSTRLLSKDELQKLENGMPINALGAIYYKCDSHLYPDKVMANLREILPQHGVRLIPRQEVTQLLRSSGKIRKVITRSEEFDVSQVVLAAGSWSRQLAAMVDISIPLVPGRGYSFTQDKSTFQLRHPALLMERSVALTPLTDSSMRFGGTMEIVPVGTPSRPRRMQGIVNAVNEYFPEANLAMPGNDQIWFGYRPCSADGLPYIGRSQKCSNLLIATGHSMLGMSLGAGTGKLIAEIASENTPSIDITPFAPERFESGHMQALSG